MIKNQSTVSRESMCRKAFYKYFTLPFPIKQYVILQITHAKTRLTGELEEKSSKFLHRQIFLWNIFSHLRSEKRCSGWCTVAPGCDYYLLLQVWVQYVSLVFPYLCSCRNRRCLSAWWMPLFEAQVRRHSWWDRPTVHHSPASTMLLPSAPPSILTFPFLLYMTNGIHKKHGLRHLATFPQLQAFVHSFIWLLLFSFSASFSTTFNHPSLMEPWWWMNIWWVYFQAVSL